MPRTCDARHRPGPVEVEVGAGKRVDGPPHGGADGSLSRTGVWTGGEGARVLDLDDRLVIAHFDGLAIVDPETSKTLGSVRFRPASGR